MFLYCCSYQSEVDNLKEQVEEMNKQINSIYELLEVLTNESKRKDLNINNINNVSKENDNKTKHTFLIDKATV